MFSVVLCGVWILWVGLKCVIIFLGNYYFIFENLGGCLIDNDCLDDRVLYDLLCFVFYFFLMLGYVIVLRFWFVVENEWKNRYDGLFLGKVL